LFKAVSRLPAGSRDYRDEEDDTDKTTKLFILKFLCSEKVWEPKTEKRALSKFK
jgi:hypothetical protein